MATTERNKRKRVTSSQTFAPLEQGELANKYIINIYRAYSTVYYVRRDEVKTENDDGRNDDEVQNERKDKR